ncbi:alpha/beta hydrolase [Desertivirga brevis]|uniref:alpha/beta hydrolase n=1 Tax=Desertivirga brevis TaxID=2810310 RepID=UPI001A97993D|nr:alpha/beta hydrolase [Pedobacter sp. SYSU D00873]
MIRKKMMSAVLMLAVLMLGACKKNEETETKPLPSEDMLNVSYGASTSNTMDVYLPENRSANTKVLVFIHGGAWATGDKSEFNSYATAMRAKGYAVVNMNYRLIDVGGTVKLQQQLDDVKAAIDYVSSKTASWNVSANVALIGASSGAHLAMLHTYAYNVDNKVKTVVSLSGPTNLTDTRNVNIQMLGVVQLLLGASPTANPQAYLNASPLYKVIATSKPTLIVHGRQDVVVPVQQAIDLKAKLDQTGVKNSLVIYENMGHEVVTSTNYVQFMATLDAWLAANL